MALTKGNKRVCSDYRSAGAGVTRAECRRAQKKPTARLGRVATSLTYSPHDETLKSKAIGGTQGPLRMES
jgi:hypothetical protein